MNPSKSIYIIAGEASGDMLAASLAKELKRQDPSLSLRGIGGNLMCRAGVELDLDITHLAVVGFWEVVKHYRSFKRIFEQTLERLQADPPAAVILVDYPGFNLRLARRIKELNIPTKVIYYVSPQVWAWKAKRVEDIRTYVDRMLVLFEFEKEFYARRRGSGFRRASAGG
jgi:lipid-A-disaccharide synthase